MKKTEITKSNALHYYFTTTYANKAAILYTALLLQHKRHDLNPTECIIEGALTLNKNHTP